MGGTDRMTPRLLAPALAGICLCAAPAMAEDGPLKLGLILDMSSLYADITGTGSETAARMAAEDFGGSVLGRKIEIVAADHQNKPDIASATAQKRFASEHVQP